MSEVNYRGWSISPPDYPAPWTAVGPNYDAWTGDEEDGGWSDNGEKADAPTREALIAEIDAWFEENEPPADELSKARMEAITLGCEWQDIAEQLQAARNNIERLEAENRQMREARAFQARVQPWLLECFGAEIAGDKLERNDRFIEESLELAQATGYSAERAHALVEYVFGRAIGEPAQEVGGVMVTLASLCLAHGLDMHDAGEIELARILHPEIVAKIRAKQAAKPTGSALPVPLDTLASLPVQP